MLYTLDSGKTITIPDNEIQKLEKSLKISYNEAVYTWLCDNDYLEDETEQLLTTKAKENRITATIHQAKAETTEKKERKPRPKKEDPEKAGIIKKLAEILPELAENVKITNETKIIEFDIGKNHYKLDLIKQRPPKK